MVCGMFVCVSLSINVCMFTVSNALLMSNATAMVRVGGMGWLKPVATVLLMLCSAVFNNNNNNICLKSHIQTSSVDYAPRELTHACSRSDTEACDMCYVF